MGVGVGVQVGVLVCVRVHVRMGVYVTVPVSEGERERVSVGPGDAERLLDSVHSSEGVRVIVKVRRVGVPVGSVVSVCGGVNVREIVRASEGVCVGARVEVGSRVSVGGGLYEYDDVCVTVGIGVYVGEYVDDRVLLCECV